MTWQQVRAVLRYGQPQQAPDGSVEDVRRESSFNLFDSVCDAQAIEPAALMTVDDATLSEWVREAMPEEARGQSMDVKIMRRLAGEYIRECEGND